MSMMISMRPMRFFGEDTWAFSLSKEGFGGRGNVHSKITVSSVMEGTRTEICISTNGQHDKLIRVSLVMRENGNEEEVGRDVIKVIPKRNSA